MKYWKRREKEEINHITERMRTSYNELRHLCNLVDVRTEVRPVLLAHQRA